MSMVQVLDADLVEPGAVDVLSADRGSGAGAAGAEQAEKKFETR